MKTAIIYGISVVLIALFIVRVRDVYVNETPELDKEQVVKISGIRKGRAFLKTPFFSGKRRLLQHPFVRSASVRFNWDFTVSISVKPRIPFACLIAQKQVLIDEEGVVLKKGDSCPPVPVTIKDLYHNEKNLTEGKVFPDSAMISLIFALWKWHKDASNYLVFPPPSSVSIKEDRQVSLEGLMYNGSPVYVEIRSLDDAGEAVQNLRAYLPKLVFREAKSHLYFSSPDLVVWK